MLMYLALIFILFPYCQPTREVGTVLHENSIDKISITVKESNQITFNFEVKLNFNKSKRHDGCIRIGLLIEPIEFVREVIEEYSVCFYEKNQFTVKKEFIESLNSKFNYFHGEVQSVKNSSPLKNIKSSHLDNQNIVTFSMELDSRKMIDFYLKKCQKINFLVSNGNSNQNYFDKRTQMSYFLIDENNEIYVHKHEMLEQTNDLIISERELFYNKSDSDFERTYIAKIDSNILKFHVEMKNRKFFTFGIGANSNISDFHNFSIFSVEYLNPTNYSVSQKFKYDSDIELNNITPFGESIKFDLIFPDYQFGDPQDVNIFLCLDIKSKVINQENQIINYCKSNSYEDSGITIGDNGKNFYVSLIPNYDGFLKKYWLPIHIYSSIAGWSGCTFLGIITACYFKHYKEWIIIHQVIIGGNSVFTLVTGVIGLIIMPHNFEKTDVPTVWLSYICGVTIISLSMFQIIIGLLVYRFSTTFITNYSFVNKIRLIHRYVGTFTYIITLIIFTTGSLINYGDIRIVPIQLFFIVCFGILRIIFTIFESKKTKEIRKIVVKTFPEYDPDEIKLIKKKFVFYDNYLVNVEDFLDSHPGGMNPLAENIGLDVSRYLTGCVPFNSKFKQHNHKYLTMKYIIEKRIFAVLNDKIMFSNDLDKSKTCVDIPCKISKVREICKETYEYKFELKNSETKFFKMLPGTTWIGKHYAVTSDSLSKTRYYSICLCLNDTIYQDHKNLLENVDLLEKDQKLIHIRDRSLFKTEFIELYIKKYDFKNGLSKYLNEEQDAEDLYIKGPIGLGLNLDKILTGTYVVIGGGTGVFCFLDFIAYVLRYLVNKICSENYYYNSNKLIKSETFDNVQDDFKLIYFSSFRDDESSLYNDICEKMKNLNDKYNLQIFKFIKKISSKDKTKWDLDFFSNHLNNVKDNISKVFICGPAPFLDGIKETLILGQIADKSKIVLV